MASTSGQRDDERLRQERETFDQHKSHENRWFALRLAMGYSSVAALLGVFLVCVYVFLNYSALPEVIVTSAAAAFFGDVVAAVVMVWRVVLNPDFMTSLAPLTSNAPVEESYGGTQQESEEASQQADYIAILSAKYGAGDSYKDVTGILKSVSIAASSGRLSLVVNNENLGGDPMKGVIKELVVTYSYAGRTQSITVREREELSLP
jgi:hypothetical protein